MSILEKMLGNKMDKQNDGKDELRAFFRLATRKGSGLMLCESPEQAQAFLTIIKPHLPKRMAGCIIRDTNINLYTWGYPITKIEEKIKQENSADKRRLMACYGKKSPWLKPHKVRGGV